MKTGAEPKKAKNKDEELELRKLYDEKKVGSDHEDLLQEVKDAREVCAQPHWEKGYKNRNSRKTAAYKRLEECMKKITPKNLYTKKDLKDFTKASKELTESVAVLDEYTKDMVFVVDQLRIFIDEMAIFKQLMNLTAVWDNSKGIIVIKPIK